MRPARTRVLTRTLAAIPPAAGAFVMGTGMVSIGFLLGGFKALSRVVLAIAALGWLALAGLLVDRALNDRGRVRREARTPAALTGVAGTAVLGTRLTLLGWSWTGAALLAIALGLWLVLLGPVHAGWSTPTAGVSLLVTVSTASLAVLSATLAASEHARWLLAVALALLLLGLAFYVVVIVRFDLHELTRGRGDQWIAGGALAISTLAAADMTLAGRRLHAFGSATGTLKDISLGLWLVTIAWLPVLVGAELLRPRPDYDVRRWSTVFPVAMYAVASFDVATVIGSSAIREFARVWLWVGVGTWLVVLAGMLRRGRRFALEAGAP